MKSDRELDCHHQRVNIQVVSRIAEFVKILQYEEISRNTPKCWNWWQVSCQFPEMQGLTVALQYCELLLLKYPEDKTFLLNIIKLRAIFYKILWGNLFSFLTHPYRMKFTFYVDFNIWKSNLFSNLIIRVTKLKTLKVEKK